MGRIDAKTLAKELLWLRKPSEFKNDPSVKILNLVYSCGFNVDIVSGTNGDFGFCFDSRNRV